MTHSILSWATMSLSQWTKTSKFSTWFSKEINEYSFGIIYYVETIRNNGPAIKTLIHSRQSRTAAGIERTWTHSTMPCQPAAQTIRHEPWFYLMKFHYFCWFASLQVDFIGELPHSINNKVPRGEYRRKKNENKQTAEWQNNNNKHHQIGTIRKSSWWTNKSHQLCWCVVTTLILAMAPKWDDNGFDCGRYQFHNCVIEFVRNCVALINWHSDDLIGFVDCVKWKNSHFEAMSLVTFDPLSGQWSVKVVYLWICYQGLRRRDASLVGDGCRHWPSCPSGSDIVIQFSNVTLNTRELCPA